MSERDEAIKKQLEDMLAVEQHVLEALERQREDENVRADVAANELVIRMERTMREHGERLKELAERFDVEPARWKAAVSSVLGVAAGLYDRVREQKLSRMLRDDYVALSLVAMSYTALHTFGLAVREDAIAQLAQDHLKDVTPLIVAVSKTLPLVVARETAETVAGADGSVGALSSEQTQRAWEPAVSGSL